MIDDRDVQMAILAAIGEVYFALTNRKLELTVGTSSRIPLVLGGRQGFSGLPAGSAEPHPTPIQVQNTVGGIAQATA